MPKAPDDYSALTLEQVKELAPDFSEATANRPYILGDHLQEGDAWVGPGTQHGDPKHADFLVRLESVFVCKNVIYEVDDRLTSAVLGREPRWPWAPIRPVTKKAPVTDAEAAAITEIEQALTAWWDDRQVHAALKRMLFQALWGKSNTFRLYVDSNKLLTNGNIEAKTLAEALDHIYVDIPEPDASFVYIHPVTRAPLGVYLYTDEDEKEACELTFLDPVTGNTVVKLLPSGEDADNDFGKRLTIFQIELPRPLITDQVRRQQNAMNMTLTLLSKGINDTHFMDKIFVDLLAPGHYEEVPDGSGGFTRGKFIPDEAGRKVGGRQDTFLQSIDFQDEEGKTKLASGHVHTEDPLDPSGTIASAEYWYQCMLEEVRQDYVLINQSATPSGKSREEARTDFADSGKDSELQAEIAGRQLLSTVVAMAEAFLGTPGKWTKKFKPVFKTNARYGKLSPEERLQNLNEVKENLLSNATAMSLNGVDDVDAEKAIISMEPSGELNLAKQRMEVAIGYCAEFPRDVALRLAGFPEEEITKIMAAVAKAGVEEDPRKEPPQPAPAPASA